MRSRLLYYGLICSMLMAFGLSMNCAGSKWYQPPMPYKVFTGEVADLQFKGQRVEAISREMFTSGSVHEKPATSVDFKLKIKKGEGKIEYTLVKVPILDWAYNSDFGLNCSKMGGGDNTIKITKWYGLQGIINAEHDVRVKGGFDEESNIFIATEIFDTELNAIIYNNKYADRD